jgi:ketosteroid isomerase-like protein
VSAANVDLIRRIYDAWSREESARDYIAEDVEYVNPSYAIERGVRRGRRSFAAVRDTLADYRVRPIDYVDAGDDDVVVLAVFEASGTDSGVPLTGEQGFIWTVRDGQAVRFRWFNSHREALNAAGVEPGKP